MKIIKSALGVTSAIARKQLYMPVAHTLGPGTNVLRVTGTVRGDALCDAPVPGRW